LAPWAKWPEKKRMLQIKTNKQTKLIELSTIISYEQILI
jgi:hypothetical protein